MALPHIGVPAIVIGLILVFFADQTLPTSAFALPISGSPLPPSLVSISLPFRLSLNVTFLFSVAWPSHVCLYSHPISCSSSHYRFGILLFGSLLLICFLIRMKAPGRQGPPLLSPLFYWKVLYGTGPSTQQVLTELLMNDFWLLSPHYVWSMPGGEDAMDFCAGWIGGCHLEPSNSLCWNSLPDLSSKLLDSAWNCHLKNLTLPWPPELYPFSLALRTPLPNL